MDKETVNYIEVKRGGGIFLILIEYMVTKKKPYKTYYQCIQKEKQFLSCRSS